MSTRRVFYGWVVVATAALGLFLGAFPIAVFAFGVFFGQFAREFHASRGAISLAFTTLAIVSALSGVIIGRLCDRFGARKVILCGLALLGMVLLSAEILGTQLWQLYVFYAAIGVVAPATTSIPYSLVVSHWFNRRRGLGLGLMMVGLGAGAIVIPPVAQRLTDSFGWRATFAIFGLVVLLLPIASVLAFLKETPAEVGLLPDGESQTAITQCLLRAPDGMTWRETWHSRMFWLMVTAFVLVAASVHACIIHMPELFADRGASARTAAMASSVLGVAVLLGRIGCGYFLDRVFGPSVALFIFLQAAAGIAFLSIGRAGPVALIGAFLVGLGFGAEVDIIAYLMSRYFGLRSFGAAFGFAFGAFVLAGGLGPLLMGIGFDRTGSYRMPLTGFFLLTLVAAAMMGRLGPYLYGTANPECERVRQGAEA